MKALTLTASLLLVSAGANATNGYFTHGIGTHNKAQAGAGIAQPSQAIDAASNPAAGALLDSQWNAGIALFSPRREYTASTSLANGNGGAFTLAPGTVQSESNWFAIPYVAKNWRLNEDSAITFSLYGRGGMNTNYTNGSASFDPDGPGPAGVGSYAGTFGSGDTGVNLSQMFIEVAYAAQLDSVTLGVSPVVAIQRFEATGLGAFSPYTASFATSGGTIPAANLTNNGSDYSYGYGVKAGVIWQATEALSLATSFQSKITMSEFDKYSDLFAEQGSFDIPASFKIGSSYAISSQLSIHLDGERTFYSDVASVSNSSSLVFNCPTAQQGGMNISNCAGGANGFGFGWSDVDAVKFGVTWQPEGMDNTTFRGGYSHADQPISSGDVLLNILAPGVIEQHFTLGLSHQLANKQVLSVALMYAPESSVEGTSLFDPTQTIELSMSQFELEVGFSW
ncbi:OmpP1/FadL family transporter [Umboniibacter marinipuniceus]|uniref:Long-chain fatty acid transport protein n=1 Tax=Umboniibacter marinipuniceus TaxID=569599 RepID=A0A3M0A2B9_9GAMM|nr:outer membrane protein transport protein [Umboniibacter marinipuniceus]RMA77609.1 long-chain fatty acid transport protein [Umboniibacter marinipuniceus]